jgi:hypothetical protein
VVRQTDPEGLVTYINYPSTEYLDLPFLDLVCFNVYLEQRQRSAYLGRLAVVTMVRRRRRGGRRESATAAGVVDAGYGRESASAIWGSVFTAFRP